MSSSASELFLSLPTVRDRVRTKIERDILADVNHPFVVKLHYGECGASWDVGRGAAGSDRHWLLLNTIKMLLQAQLL